MNRSAVVVGTLVALGVAVFAGCGGSEVPVLQNEAANLKGGDAGNGTCGATACATGELCCESADESCAPICSKVTKCPVYGRPCKTDAGPAPDAGPRLQWYTTCGDPVCRDRDGGSDAGAVVCPALGTSCSTKGATCGNPALSCGAVAVCDDHDPKGGGCPISTKKAKEDIDYVSDAELARLHDETIRMKLATYRYKGPFVDPSDPNARHLGFIVEDQPTSLSVDRGHDRVDLYGYVSMAVATMQVQDRQIATLRKQVDALEASCAKKAAPR